MRRIYKAVFTTLIGFSLLGCTPAESNEIGKGEAYQSAADQEINIKTTDLDLYGAFQVKYVIDGDTFVISLNDDEDIKIRLIGVDTPESVNQTHPELNCEEGDIASTFTKELLEGQEVWLELDQEETDKSDRVLAYVYLDPDAEVMLQDLLLSAGMANCMPIYPNVKYQNHFAMLEEQARIHNIGFWQYDFWN